MSVVMLSVVVLIVKAPFDYRPKDFSIYSKVVRSWNRTSEGLGFEDQRRQKNLNVIDFKNRVTKTSLLAIISRLILR
jgi:hypothetical protein